MTKLLSFRGEFELPDGARETDMNIFTYTSPDLTRAWKIESFYLWPKTIRGSSATGDGQFNIAASLATDTIGSVGFADVMSVEDNRQIAWMNKGYNMRNASDDFITSPTGLEDNAALVDPDHIVNRNLYINIYTTSNFTISLTREYNYLLILREVKVSESEAILQMVKGVAQDIIN